MLILAYQRHRFFCAYGPEAALAKETRGSKTMENSLAKPHEASDSPCKTHELPVWRLALHESYIFAAHLYHLYVFGLHPNVHGPSPNWLKDGAHIH
jgi:hypothetical protein